MSQQLINLSADLTRLVEEGYAVRIESGHLIVEEIPYLDEIGKTRRGVFVCPLDATDRSTLPPTDHVMSFAGGMPHDRSGRPLEALGRTSPRCGDLSGLTAQHGFSNKPHGPGGKRNYRDYHEKVTTYEAIIVGEVHAVDPLATAKVGALEPSKSDDDPFVFPDSASARAGTTALAAKLNKEIIAHIGLGGTGSYILDHVAKAPVSEVRLIDGDRFYPHNAFRAPGSASRSELQPPQFKVEYHAGRYRQMKKNILTFPENLSGSNMHLLDGVTFAFVSMDAGPDKVTIISQLELRKIPFVEVGMGLHIGSQGIGGTLRAVLSTDENRDLVRPHIPIEEFSGDRLYAENIQISDLNSLNADMAVQLWKGLRGFYANFGEPIWLYQVETRRFIREAA